MGNTISRIQCLSKMDDIEQLYTSDIVRVTPTTVCVCTDSEIAESNFIKHCRDKLSVNQDGPMTVEMPWKSGLHEKLACNISQAKIYLKKQEKRLIKKGTPNEYNTEK